MTSIASVSDLVQPGRSTQCMAPPVQTRASHVNPAPFHPKVQQSVLNVCLEPTQRARAVTCAECVRPSHTALYPDRRTRRTASSVRRERAATRGRRSARNVTKGFTLIYLQCARVRNAQRVLTAAVKVLCQSIIVNHVRRAINLIQTAKFATLAAKEGFNHK